METKNQITKINANNLSNSGTTASEICSIADVLRLQAPTLAKLNKDEPAKLVSGLNALISDLGLFFNVGKQMDSDQAKETAKLILKYYYFLKVADLVLFIEWFKLGRYGKTFDRIDGNVILIALEQYVNERIKYSQDKNDEAHKETKENGAKYLIKIGEKFVRVVEQNGMPWIKHEDKKELATYFSESEVYNVRKLIIKNNPEILPASVVITFNKPEIGLMEYLAKEKPDLHKEIKAASTHKKEIKAYAIESAKIMSDESLSEIQKENKMRELAGLQPLTDEELFNRAKYNR